MGTSVPDDSDLSSVLARLDTTVAHPARRYNYWLGGKDNFAADRASGDAVAEALPSVRLAARENRAFLRRAVTYLTRDIGLRQFLDIGTGIPAADNTHEVAQALAPDSRVVYVDNDPIVLTHARALLTSAPEGATAYLDADLNDPDSILAHPDVRRTLDFSRPVALTLLAVLHFIESDDHARRVVRRLVQAVAPGSYLVISHGATDHLSPATMADVAAGKYGSAAPRPLAEIATFFEGLELVPPGLVSVADWRAEAEPEPRPLPADIGMYGAVARIS